jgi:hypothetical protein
MAKRPLYDRMNEALTLDKDEWPRAPRREDGTRAPKVAIVGKGPMHLHAPFGDPEYELWGLNDAEWRPGYAPVESFHRWFQLHNPEYMSVHYPVGVIDLETQWSKKVDDTILYMDRHYPEYPNSVPLPVSDMTDGFPYYHTSSFDWMVAMAIHEGFEAIEMYGCDFRTFPTTLDGEPVSGRACLEYWLGYAQGKGIDVKAYTTGDLFLNVHVAVFRSTLRYGLDREPALDLGLAEDDGGYWSDVR